MSQPTNINLAVLIDGDNIPSDYVKEMMEEIAKYGNPTIKRIYGDWTKPNLSKWKNMLLEHAITPIQQYGYTTGKNATDSAMIIDAMDILYSEKVNGFCIVSSDSDFTRLATRLREAGMQIIGIGEKKTPNPFIVACDKFIYIEILKAQSKEKASEEEKELEKESIEKEFGGPLVWERLDTKRACLIKAETTGNVFDKDQWEAMIAFMVDAMVRLEKSLKDPLIRVNPKLKALSQPATDEPAE
jgi:uncharacterized LabA/DUF88 family protein